MSIALEVGMLIEGAKAMTNEEKWQAIETFKLDEHNKYDEFLLWDGMSYYVGCYELFQEEWADQEGMSVEPTHWRKLPEPPKQKESL